MWWRASPECQQKQPNSNLNPGRSMQNTEMRCFICQATQGCSCRGQFTITTHNTTVHHFHLPNVTKPHFTSSNASTWLDKSFYTHFLYCEFSKSFYLETSKEQFSVGLKLLKINLHLDVQKDFAWSMLISICFCPFFFLNQFRTFLAEKKKIFNQGTRKHQGNGIANQAIVRTNHLPTLWDELFSFQSQGADSHLGR